MTSALGAGGCALLSPSSSAAPGTQEHENRLLKRAVAILTARLSAQDAAIAELGTLRAQLSEAQAMGREVTELLRKERLARYTAEAHLREAQRAQGGDYR